MNWLYGMSLMLFSYGMVLLGINHEIPTWMAQNPQLAPIMVLVGALGLSIVRVFGADGR